MIQGWLLVVGLTITHRHTATMSHSITRLSKQETISVAIYTHDSEDEDEDEGGYSDPAIDFPSQPDITLCSALLYIL